MQKFDFYVGARFRCRNGATMTVIAGGQDGCWYCVGFLSPFDQWLCKARLTRISPLTDVEWTVGDYNRDPVEQLPPWVPVSDEVWQHCEKHGLTNLRVGFGPGRVACTERGDGYLPIVCGHVASLYVDAPAPKPQPLTLHDFEVGKTVLKSNRHGTMHVVSGVNHVCVSVTPDRDGVRSFTFGAIGELFSLVKDVTCVPATKEGLGSQ